MKMLKRSIPAILMTTLLSGNFAIADEPMSKEQPDMDAMMKKMEIAGAPGAAHKALEPLIGTWKAEVKNWMSPGSPPTVTQGTAKKTWIMNGRFVQEEFKGEFLGKAFRGMGLTGYDNTKKGYSNIWIDDMHTALYTSEGTADSGGKVITFEGKYDCPITGQKDRTMKQVIRIVSRNQHVLEMYDPGRGENGKTMEITYTRR